MKVTIDPKVYQDLQTIFTYMLMQKGFSRGIWAIWLIFRKSLKDFVKYVKVQNQSKRDLDRVATPGPDIQASWEIVQEESYRSINNTVSGETVAEVGIFNEKYFVHVYSGGTWANWSEARNLVLSCLIFARLNNGIVLLPQEQTATNVAEEVEIFEQAKLYR
jgi:hypothetical protein